MKKGGIAQSFEPGVLKPGQMLLVLSLGLHHHLEVQHKRSILIREMPV
jgi:hypothetical protein